MLMTGSPLYPESGRTVPACSGPCHQFAAELLHDRDLLGFCFRLGLLADRHVAEGQFVALGLTPEGFVVGNNAGELTGHFTGTEAQDGVVETVVDFGDKEGDLGLFRRQSDLYLHAQFFRSEFFEGCGLLFDLPDGAHSTRWKKILAPRSLCWSAWWMLLPRKKIQLETRDTRPGWSGPKSRAMMVCDFISRRCVAGC